MQHYSINLLMNLNGRKSFRLPLSLLLTLMSSTALNAQGIVSTLGAALSAERSIANNHSVLLGSMPGAMLTIANNEIRIILRDSETGQPIVGARIEITGQEGVYRTDDKGVLYLPAQLGGVRIKLRISAEGYVRQDLDLAEGLTNELDLFLDKPDRKLKGQLCNDAGLNKGYFSPVTQPELKGVLKLAGKTETGTNPFTELPASKNK